MQRLIFAVKLNFIALHESEPRTAYDVTDGVSHVIRAQAVGLNLWCKNLSESRLAIGHVALGVDVQYTIVHEPSIGCVVMEGVAVGFLYAAVGRQPKVHQARFVYVSFVQVAQQHFNTHAFVVVGGGAQPAAVGVGSVHGSYYIVWRCRYTYRNE